MREKKMGLYGAIALIASCMIGTGVFTSLGYQLVGIDSSFAIMVLWLTGGLVAICGALIYSKLSVLFPGSGGEYNYLGKIYHPAVGFLSGWTSSTIGFAAPIAAASIAFSKYFGTFYTFGPYHSYVVSIAVILLAAVINMKGLNWAEWFQKYATLLNIILIVLLVVLGFFAWNWGKFSNNQFTVGAKDWQAVFSHSFAVSLIYVSYAYSGWNAVTYIGAEVENPKKTIPLSLVLAVFLVSFLYLSLNMVFLYRADIELLRGENEVAHIASAQIFGSIASSFVSLLICFCLFASVLGMSIAGPRVISQIAQDYPPLQFFGKKNRDGAPVIAIVVQVFISTLLVLTSSFDMVIRYVGFSLALFTCLTVAGWVILIIRNHTFLCGNNLLLLVPATIFVLLELWMLYYTLIDHPTESLLGIITVCSGLLVYFFNRNQKNQPYEL